MEYYTELETQRLILRKLKTSDLDDLCEYGFDPEVSKYVMWHRYNSRTDGKTFITAVQASDGYFWAIEHKADCKMIGAINFIDLNTKHGRGELAYTLNRQYWNMGIMTEAAHAVMKFGFEKLLLNKITAGCVVANTGSSKVMEKLGMTHEGTFRNHLKKLDQYFDIAYYGILKSEYFKRTL